MTFDVTGTEDVIKGLEKAINRYPYTAEQVLKREGRGIKKDLKTRVQEEAKGHHYRSKNNTDEENEAIAKKALAESFSLGKVVRHGNQMTIAVLSKAPHYHLYEEGHAIVTHDRVINGKKKLGTRRYTGRRAVERKTVARYMAQRAEHAELIGQQVLDEIIKEAGLD
jgi:hypothetical protein